MQKDISEKAESVLSFYKELEKDHKNLYGAHPSRLDYKSTQNLTMKETHCLLEFKSFFSDFYTKQTINQLNKIYFRIPKAPDQDGIVKFWKGCVENGFLPHDFFDTLKIEDTHFSFELTIDEKTTTFELYVYISNFRCVYERRSVHKLVNFMTDLGYDFVYALLSVNFYIYRDNLHSWVSTGGFPIKPFCYSSAVIKELSPFTKNLTKESFGPHGITVWDFMFEPYQHPNWNISKSFAVFYEKINKKYGKNNVFIGLESPESFAGLKGEQEQLVA